MLKSTPLFVFDVESIGLFGEGFAVAGGVYVNGVAKEEFCFCCPAHSAQGDQAGREWVAANVPALGITHPRPIELRDAFWKEMQIARNRYPGLIVAADCNWPVEANFLTACVRQDLVNRTWTGPYPFVDIDSILLAGGWDPATVEKRMDDELPVHHPLMDARHSARLLWVAIDEPRL